MVIAMVTRKRKIGRARAPRSADDQLKHAEDSQAKRVLMRFGGVARFVAALLQCGVRRTPQSVYHWVKEGGLIPPNGVRDVFLAEEQAGITLTDADWSPYVHEVEPDPTAVEDTTDDGVEIVEDAPPEETEAPARKWVL